MHRLNVDICTLSGVQISASALCSANMMGIKGVVTLRQLHNSSQLLNTEQFEFKLHNSSQLLVPEQFEFTLHNSSQLLVWFAQSSNSMRSDEPWPHPTTLLRCANEIDYILFLSVVAEDCYCQAIIMI